MPEDLEIIERVLDGDVDCFADLIARHQKHVAKIVSRHVPPDRVEEIAHEVFVRAYTGLAGYSTGVPFQHFFMRLEKASVFILKFQKMYQCGQLAEL